MRDTFMSNSSLATRPLSLLPAKIKMSIKTITTTFGGVERSISFPISLYPTPPRTPSPIGLPETKRCHSVLLDLPAELRLRIYAFALTLDPNLPSKKPHPKPQNLIGRLPSPSLLLTCRQIYHEARLLPFQINAFDFQPFYSRNLQCSRQFLRQLESWQVCEIRDLRLAVIERDVKAWGIGYLFLDVCDMLGSGLRSLRLELQGSFENYNWLETEAPWVADGLFRLKRLHRLDIVSNDKGVEQLRLEEFESALRQKINWARRVEVRKMTEAEKVEAHKAQQAQMVQTMRSSGIVGPLLNLGMLMASS